MIKYEAHNCFKRYIYILYKKIIPLYVKEHFTRRIVVDLIRQIVQNKKYSLLNSVYRYVSTHIHHGPTEFIEYLGNVIVHNKDTVDYFYSMHKNKLQCNLIFGNQLIFYREGIEHLSSKNININFSNKCIGIELNNPEIYNMIIRYKDAYIKYINKLLDTKIITYKDIYINKPNIDIYINIIREIKIDYTSDKRLSCIVEKFTFFCCWYRLNKITLDNKLGLLPREIIYLIIKKCE